MPCALSGCSVAKIFAFTRKSGWPMCAPSDAWAIPSAMRRNAVTVIRVGRIVACARPEAFARRASLQNCGAERLRDAAMHHAARPEHDDAEHAGGNRADAAPPLRGGFHALL